MILNFSWWKRWRLQHRRRHFEQQQRPIRQKEIDVEKMMNYNKYVLGYLSKRVLFQLCNVAPFI